MKNILKNEFIQLFSRKWLASYFSLFIFLVAGLAGFLKMFAPGSSFGGVMKTLIGTFSPVVILLGVVLTLVSYSQEVQKGTIKNWLICPVSRSKIIMAKLLSTTFLTVVALATLFLISFLVTTVLFGFFAVGLYSSEIQNVTDFYSALFQLVTAFFTGVFYSNIVLLLFLLTNSLSGTIIIGLCLRGMGEMISKTKSVPPLAYSPFGVLNLLNPLEKGTTFTIYLYQIIFVVLYSLVLFYLSCKFFESKEF